MANHLRLTPYGFYFRMAVPMDVRPFIGRTELKRALSANSRKVAVRRARALAANADSLFERIRYEMARDPWIQEMTFHGVVFKRGSAEVKIERVELDPRNPREEMEQFKELVFGLDKELAFGLDEPIPVAAPLAPVAAEVKPARANRLISELVGLYVKDKVKRNCWKPATVTDNEESLQLMIDFLGDRPIQDITHDDTESFVETMQKLPPNRSKKKEYKGKTLQQLLEMSHKKTLSNRTINTITSRIGSFWSWAVAKKHTEIHPFTGMQIKIREADEDERDPFTGNDLKQIFSTKVFTQGKFLHPHYYWLPLISLHTGMGLEEISQLHCADIVQKTSEGSSEQIWVIENTECTEEHLAKSLKTPSRKRHIPVHPLLIDIGLLEYKKLIEATGAVRLFPELTFYNNKWGHYPSKWFQNFRKKLVLEPGKKDFHSFRHTFASTLKNLMVNKDIIADLMGHTHPGETHRYAKSFVAPILYLAIKKLDYSDLLSHIATPFRTKK